MFKFSKKDYTQKLITDYCTGCTVVSALQCTRMHGDCYTDTYLKPLPHLHNLLSK